MKAELTEPWIHKRASVGQKKDRVGEMAAPFLSMETWQGQGEEPGLCPGALDAINFWKAAGEQQLCEPHWAERTGPGRARKD